MEEMDLDQESMMRPEILIVDDELGQLEIIKKILIDERYTLRLANSGELALSSVKNKTPDLILLDVEMPEMNGYDVCKRIKLNEATRAIPVIFLSSQKEIEEKTIGFETGGIDYIVKPYNPLEVIEKVESHLKLFYLTQRLSMEKIYKDQLTGVHNRRYFVEKIMRLNKTYNLPISIVIAEIKGLKITNDVYGFSAGDVIIRRSSAILRQFLGNDDCISRYGGDRFAILLCNKSSAEAESYTREVIKSLKFFTTDKEQFSFIFGLQTKTSVDENLFDILRNAEDELCRNKMLTSSSDRYGMVETIMNTLYDKSPSEREHSERVSAVVEEIGKAMNMSEADLDSLKMAGLFHDIGKIIIQDRILNKPETLTSQEWDEMKSHSELGFRIINNIPELSDVAEIIHQHHERWDGKGYPRGLSGEKISKAARMISIAEAFDAMTSERPYKQKNTYEEALKDIMRNAGSHFDPEIAETFVRCIRKQY